MKVLQIPVAYYQYRPIAGRQEHTNDPEILTQSMGIRPVTLAGKLTKFMSRVDEVKFISQGLSPYAIYNSFDTAFLRVSNSLVAFVNDRTIRSDLVVYDYTAPKSSRYQKRKNCSFCCYEAGWYIQTKREDVYVELTNRLVHSEIKQSLGNRISNMITRHGPTSKTIPAVRWVLSLKVFNTPASCYVMDLFTSDEDYKVGSSSEIDGMIRASNVDIFDTDREPTQEERELYELRKVYFRKSSQH